MTFKQACDQLRQHTVRAVRPGLSRTKKLLTWIGSPDQFLPAVQITGSNGKGSVATMMETVLCHAGYRVGKFTSPHLHHERERIVVAGKMVSAYYFIQAVQVLLPALQKLKKQGDPATTFEAWTVLAAIVFQKRNVDIVILEVGMGGRLDATTVWRNKVLSVITNIHLEHTAYLGSTKAAICKEKLGILKPGIPLVTGVHESELRQLIHQTAVLKKSPVFFAGSKAKDTMRMMGYKTGRSGFEIQLVYQKKSVQVKIPCEGIFQVHNAALACLALKILEKYRFTISDQNLRTGMRAIHWPGRMEKILEKPAIYLDGSHNPAAVSAALEGWVKSKKRIYLIVGVMQDKAVPEMVRNYSQVAKKVWTVTPPDERGLPAERLADIFRNANMSAIATKSMREALQRVWKCAKRNDIILISGSLYILAPGKRALHRWIKAHKKG